jgi:ribonuclease BN (tRNA processing enzyme)
MEPPKRDPMKVQVLGCSGAIGQGCRTTSFLIDGDVLIDAGTGVGDLSQEQMLRIDQVFLTHSHLDHVAALPLMVDAVASRRVRPLQVYALAGTITALRSHVFNDVIWPDFTRLPTQQAPLLRFHEIQVGQKIQAGNKQVEVLPAIHTVPAAGYAVSKGGACWVFSGDTERNPAFWARVNQLKVGMLVIETAFSSREKELAALSKHLSPDSLASELGCIAPGNRYPIYITHTKPAETELIMSEIQKFEVSRPASTPVSHDIRWLRAGQEFEL